MRFDSGSELPEGWEFWPLEAACSRVTSGGTPSRKRPEFFGGTIPWVKTQELRDCVIYSAEEFITEDALAKSSAKLLPANTVLLAMYGATVGQLGVLGQEATCNQACCAFIVDQKKADHRFLYYTLLGHRKNIVGLATGAAQQNLSGKTLKSVELPFPPLAEQKGIADLLWSIDQKIANNRALAADLEAMARTIFKSWFVDFDPVKAKMEGRAPTGMDADTAALFPDELVESELGLIPKGWEVGTLESQADLNPESWSARNHPDAVQYADLSGTDRGQILETKEFAWTDAPSRARRALRPGDTIVGTVRPGNRAYSYVGIDGLTGSTGFAVLRPHGTSQRSFVYLAATSDDAIERLTNLADGAAYPAVRPDAVLATPIVAPPDTVLREFAKLTAPLLDWMVAGHAENTELAKLRDTLLPRLISGKLRPPYASTELEPSPCEEQANV